MTPGNNGASTPEDDDPFGYLYADGQANGAQPPSGGYGTPGGRLPHRATAEADGSRSS
ncbi:CBM6 domain-containing protein OS=Streptomyces violarus OX=67380 GN=FHS41_007850 PE=4 SV=1 [Streptomyces violarus]